MPTVTQLLAQHGCLLILDAASRQVQTGLLRKGQPAIWRSATTEAGTGLFSGVDECLREAGVDFAAIGAFVFCEGPGSMLGIRTVAMAVRTWQTISAHPCPAYRYQSLPLLAHELVRANAARPTAVIADARRDSWHCVTIAADGDRSLLQRLPTAELPAPPTPLWQPHCFRAWAEPPRATHDCAYDVAALLAAHADRDLVTATDAPDAYQATAPDYKKWSAQIHRAPAK